MSSGRRRLAPDAAFAHHIDAQRMVRDLRRDIDRARQPGQRVEILRKALPLPVQPFRQRRAGDVLDRLHQIDQLVAVLRPHRREPDAAIAEQDRRHAMPGGGRQHRVPGRLPVVMRMDIDPARRDQQPLRLDDPPCRPGLVADRNDALAVDRDIARKARRAGAVDNGPAPDDDIVHRACLRDSCLSYRECRQHAGRGLAAQHKPPHGAHAGPPGSRRNSCRIRALPPIFEGQPGKLLPSPAPCPYRRIRSLRRTVSIRRTGRDGFSSVSPSKTAGANSPAAPGIMGL